MLIFVHGTLRKGQRLNPVLAKADYIGTGELVTPLTVLVALSKTTFPAAVTINDEWYARDHAARLPHSRCHPVGEVYMVDGPTLKHLDQIEGHPTFYQRFNGDVALGAPELARLRSISEAYVRKHKEEPVDPHLLMRYKSRLGCVAVGFYGMRPSHQSLMAGTIINNGDWVNPSWGMPYKEYFDTHVRLDEARAREFMERNREHAVARPRPRGLFQNGQHVRVELAVDPNEGEVVDWDEVWDGHGVEIDDDADVVLR